MSNEPKFKVGDIVEVINDRQHYGKYGERELPLGTRLKVVGHRTYISDIDPIVEKISELGRPFPICRDSVKVVSEAEPKKPLTLFELKEGKKYRGMDAGSSHFYFLKDGTLYYTNSLFDKPDLASGRLTHYSAGFEEITFEPKPLKLASLAHTVVKNEDGSVSAGCQRITKEDRILLIKYLQEEQ